MDVHLSVVYGSHSASVRKELWRELMRISQVVQGPWLVAGDFNTVQEVYEKNGGRDLYVPQRSSFHFCKQFCHLFDMRARGHIWSWSKKSVESRRIMVRLRLSWKGASGWIGLTLKDQRDSASSSSSHEIRPLVSCTKTRVGPSKAADESLFVSS